MRLWTLHPEYLDGPGLVAVWREALLAQKVLAGRTRGYRSHPQLERFRRTDDPAAAIASYLEAVYREACVRGYRFDSSKIGPARAAKRIAETSGQLLYEWEHLERKLRKRVRQPGVARLKNGPPRAHPLFRIVKGGVRDWEKVPPEGAGGAN